MQCAVQVLSAVSPMGGSFISEGRDGFKVGSNSKRNVSCCRSDDLLILRIGSLGRIEEAHELFESTDCTPVDAAFVLPSIFSDPP